MDHVYVSRGGNKLDSIAEVFQLDFRGMVVLDVGSSTGGFSDYALQHGAIKVIAVEAGAHQLHPSLRLDQRIELHEKTDIRDFPKPLTPINLILIDVSFISLRDILPSVYQLASQTTKVVAMVKPQFEAVATEKNHGIVKNDHIRRLIFKDFESWVRSSFVILQKADSKVAGSMGNVERFYLLMKH
jgi:23S rRNA (cytidine1920-2'-O)/16S rRNA (cytidine1409-2'-O)-methyltransferase